MLSPLRSGNCSRIALIAILLRCSRHCVISCFGGEGIALEFVPSATEIELYCASRLGSGAVQDRLNVSFLQGAAPAIWGAEVAAMIGRNLRQSRLTEREPALTLRGRAEGAIDGLPSEWRAPLRAQMELNKRGPRATWSAAYGLSVAQALARWLDWCQSTGRDPQPSGLSFHAYAGDLETAGVSVRSVGDYLARVLSGYACCVEPGFRSEGSEQVIAMSVAKAKAAGSPTKTGSQLVGASAIYDLGLELIERARGLGPRSLAVSIEFRNGLLLAIAAALPQRARALSLLFFGSSLCLQEFPVVRISLPGHALKLPEHRKRGEGFERVFENADLWCALDDYQRLFRPLFDDGDALFPSARDFGVALDSRRLGKLVGDLTEQHLGVRVSIHRVRDNVATEASEELRSGGYPAPALLGHSNPATTMANYDHARGVGAARDHLCFLETQRSFKAALRL